MFDMATFRYDPDPRPAGLYDPDPRRAFTQWRVEYDIWLVEFDVWSLHVELLEREEFDRRRQHYPTWQAFAQMLQDLREKWKVLRLARPKPPPYPEQCQGLTCGAKTRHGTPCQRRDLGAGARCKLHGGRSTGPKTAQGKRRAVLNGFRPKRKRTS